MNYKNYPTGKTLKLVKNCFIAEMPVIVGEGEYGKDNE